VPYSPPLLILWDIDHTLIETGGVGREVYAAAFEKITGRRLEQMAPLAGRTEPVIFRETLALHGLHDPGGLFARFAAEQARGYAERASDLRQRGRALPGAVQALEALADRDGVLQSVLTGNTRPSAEAKLRAFGLDSRLDLEAGAYGTDSDERALLVGVARDRAARRAGQAFGPGSTLIIGDTPADVIAARDGQARVIAIATGDFTAVELARAGAPAVLRNLADTRALMSSIYPAPAG
jgi:phosphoglycolate phosphatase-like HAD superfamily hydrolase